ncbi:hypothetical protein ABIA32_003294 [Streptacidiphilus sp. MAP12-20]|uniref:hypothetical protein n=1 Tax=Streptacidiphilus sp. MAP12-20 TaxID=3156299 RepID=UPI003510F290
MLKLQKIRHVTAMTAASLALAGGGIIGLGATAAHADTNCSGGLGGSAGYPWWSWTIHACLKLDGSGLHGVTEGAGGTTDVRLYVKLWRECNGNTATVVASTNNLAYPSSGSAVTSGATVYSGCDYYSESWLTESGNATPHAYSATFFG